MFFWCIGSLFNVLNILVGVLFGCDRSRFAMHKNMLPCVSNSYLKHSFRNIDPCRIVWCWSRLGFIGTRLGYVSDYLLSVFVKMMDDVKLYVESLGPWFAKMVGRDVAKKYLKILEKYLTTKIIKFWEKNYNKKIVPCWVFCSKKHAPLPFILSNFELCSSSRQTLSQKWPFHVDDSEKKYTFISNSK